jgi:RHS repeat-associated protein
LKAYYVRGRDQLLAVIRERSVHYYAQDGLGSVRELTDASGAVTDWYGYTAFGEALNWSGSEGQPYRFAGEEWNGAAVRDEYNLRAREYATSTGRFLQIDTAPPTLTLPETIGRYVYAGNEPIGHVDPTGRSYTLADVSAALGIEDVLHSIPVQNALVVYRAIDKLQAVLTLTRAVTVLLLPKTTAEGQLREFETPLGNVSILLGKSWGAGTSGPFLKVEVSADPEHVGMECGPLGPLGPGALGHCTFSGALGHPVTLWKSTSGLASVSGTLKVGVRVPGQVNRTAALGGIQGEASMSFEAKVGGFKVSKELSFDQLLDAAIDPFSR